MASKNIQIVYDVDSRDVNIASDRTLSLVQQLRILKKELQNPNLGQQQFEILRKKVGDVEDQIARTNTRSKDFLGVLSTLPGPVGTFGSSLLGVVDTLKVFSGFSFKDIKNSLGDLADDVVDITTGFFGLKKAQEDALNTSQTLTKSTEDNATATEKSNAANVNATNTLNANASAAGAAAVGMQNLSREQRNAITHGQQYDETTKSVTSAQQNMIAATNKANQAVANSVPAINTATTAINTLTFAQRASAMAAQALKIALASLGIGIIIAALVALGSVLIDGAKKLLGYEESTKETEAAVKALNDALKEQERLLGVNLEAIDAATRIQKLRAQVAGKTEEEIFNIVRQGGKDRLEELRRYDNELYEEQRKVSKNEVMTAEEKAKLLDDINQKLLKSNLDIIKQINANEEALLQEQLRVANLRKERNKKSGDDEYQRKLKELDAMIQLEIDKDNTSQKILTELLDKRAALVRTKEKQSAAEQQLIRQQNSKRVQDSLNEDTSRLQDYLKKTEEIRIAALEDDEDRRLQAASNKLYFDKIALSKDKEFIKKSEDEKKEIFSQMETATQMEILKIREEFLIKKIEQFDREAIAVSKAGTLLAERERGVNAIRLQQQGDFNAVFGDRFFGNKGLLALYNQYFTDLRAVYQKEYDANVATYDAEQILLDQALADKKISQQKYDEEVAELGEKRLQNQEQLVQRQIQLDQLEVDSRRASADKTVEIGQNLVNLLSAVAGKSKGIQVAAAITEAGVAIARIIIDTQRAIIAFSASVAPLGPAGIPIAASYAVKAKIAAALSIATIVAQGINRLKEIKSADSGDGGGQQSNQMGRGYARGGVIQGRRHAQGGTIIEAEDGEAVMTRGAVTLFRPMLSMMNQMGGGTTFAPNLMTTSLDKPITANPSEEQQPIIVKSYVVEKELTGKQQQTARLKDLSTL